MAWLYIGNRPRGQAAQQADSDGPYLNEFRVSFPSTFDVSIPPIQDSVLEDDPLSLAALLAILSEHGKNPSSCARLNQLIQEATLGLKLNCTSHCPRWSRLSGWLNSGNRDFDLRDGSRQLKAVSGQEQMGRIVKGHVHRHTRKVPLVRVMPGCPT